MAASSYHLLKKVTIGGEGGWDYLTVDAENRRVYVSHSTEVDVLNADTFELIGKVEGLKGVHGIAIAPAMNRGFISNGAGNSVTIFDLKTLKHIDEDVPVGHNPDAILYDPATRRVFAFNGRDAKASVIDAELGAMVGQVELQGKPEFAVSNDANIIFVNLEDKSRVLRIDARKELVERSFPLTPCEEPSGLAIDRNSKRLFVGCGNEMMAILDSESGKVIKTMPICKGIDATAFDPGTGLIFNSCGDGAVAIVHEDSPDSFSAVDSLKTQQGSRTMAVDPKTHNLFLPAAEFEAAAPAQNGQQQRRRIAPGSFSVLVFGQ